ncbi:MAG: PEP-CTERM sorting domain-containing protein [Acetobacteraceae bacterium]|nr:PEP-CTERM sorting domain-containing protein [Acetobacteraceae bacterium]
MFKAAFCKLAVVIALVVAGTTSPARAVIYTLDPGTFSGDGTSMDDGGTFNGTIIISADGLVTGSVVTGPSVTPGILAPFKGMTYVKGDLEYDIGGLRFSVALFTADEPIPDPNLVPHFGDHSILFISGLSLDPNSSIVGPVAVEELRCSNDGCTSSDGRFGSTFAFVPEPISLTMLAAGLGSVCIARRRRT